VPFDVPKDEGDLIAQTADKSKSDKSKKSLTKAKKA
jgi:hypothetical protein